MNEVWRARSAAQQAQALARDRLRAAAADGKTSRGARRADGTRVHLLGVAEHGGHLPGHLEAGVKHNETSYFTGLPEPLDLAGAVVTFDALHTVRANLDWLTGKKKGHYIAVVKKNQPLLHARIRALIRTGTGHSRNTPEPCRWRGAACPSRGERPLLPGRFGKHRGAADRYILRAFGNWDEPAAELVMLVLGDVEGRDGTEGNAAARSRCDCDLSA